MTDIKSLLEKLSNAHGISGREESVQQIVKDELAPYVDDIRSDELGNLIAVKNGERPSIMIEAHADEIGLMVMHIDEMGFIYFIKIGGWFDQTLLNQRVIIHARSGEIVGVIGSKPPHFMTIEDKKKIVEAKDMFIDVGCRSQKEVEDLGISVGTPISIDRTFTTMHGDIVTGKAFDNRSGLVIMIEALKRTKSKSSIYAVAAVQEEVGLKGARVAAFGLNPDIAIVTDVSPCGDHPGIDRANIHLEVGKGPVITVADGSGRGFIATPNVVEWLVGAAEDLNMQIQLEASDGGTTDASAIYITRSGIPTGSINVASRYSHSPVEVISLNDIDKAVDLMAKALEIAPKYFGR